MADQRQIAQAIDEQPGERGERGQLPLRRLTRGGPGEDHPQHERQQGEQHDERGDPAHSGDDRHHQHRAECRMQPHRREAGVRRFDRGDMIDRKGRAFTGEDRAGEDAAEQLRDQPPTERSAAGLRCVDRDAVDGKDRAGAHERAEQDREIGGDPRCCPPRQMADRAGDPEGEQGRPQHIEHPEKSRRRCSVHTLGMAGYSWSALIPVKPDDRSIP